MAGGALLFEGISNLLGHHAGPFGSSLGGFGGGGGFSGGRGAGFVAAGTRVEFDNWLRRMDSARVFCTKRYLSGNAF